jgi:hypothetical protein
MQRSRWMNDAWPLFVERPCDLLFFEHIRGLTRRKRDSCCHGRMRAAQAKTALV